MRRPLRCYLLRPGVDPGQAFSDAASNVDLGVYVYDGASLSAVDDLDSFDQGGSYAPEPIVVTLASTTATQWWLESLSSELPEDEGFLVGPVPSRGAVIFCPVADPQGGSIRWIVWTFGIGSRYLDRRTAEPRFGVISALNRIIAEEGEQAFFRKLQYRQQGPYQQRVGHVAASDTPFGGFRIDQVRDLIAAIGGTPSDDDAQVFGARNLLFRTDIENLTETLVAESPDVMAVYRDDRYQAEFGFIDNYLPVEDETLIEQLDSVLLHELKERSDTVDVALPDDLVDFSDDRFLEYVLLPDEQISQANRRVLTIGRVQNLVGDRDVDVLDVRLRFADVDHTPLGRASLRDCLAAELQLNNERYYLADGTYFLVDKAFIESLDEEIASIPSWDGDLPSYKGGREDAWIAEAAQGGLAVLDGTLIYLPQSTPFEPADLVGQTGALIHAKRKGRSRDLSYLFTQASVSAQMLSEAPEAVEKLRTLVDENASPGVRDQILQSLEALNRNRPDLDVVLAILGYTENRSAKNIPLLAKLELVAAIRSIRQSGFNPHLVLIPLGLQSDDSPLTS